MRAHSLAVAAILALVAPRGLAGQTVPSPYRFVETRQEVGLLGGWISPGTGRFGYGPKPGPLAGIRYALEFAGPLSIEATVGVVPTTRDVVDPRRAEGSRVIGETDALLVGADGRVKLSLTGQRTWRGLNPYVITGGGITWDAETLSVAEVDLPETDRFDFGSSFIASIGGGVRWFATDLMVLRGEVLLNLWKLEAPDGFRDPERGFGDVGESEWANAGSFTLGIGYRF